MKVIEVKICPLTDHEHEKSNRQYAHAGHLAGYQDEKEADVIGSELSGYKIKRQDCKYGNNLEVI